MPATQPPLEALSTAPMSLYFHPLYTDGIHPDARFPRDRYHRIAERLRTDGPHTLIDIRTSPLATRDQLLLAHDTEYVDRFLGGTMSRSESRKIGLRPWTPLIIPRTLHIVGGAIAALEDALHSGGLAANMAGGTHHAHRNWGSGYCVFNDIAICALLAKHRFGLHRIVSLDLDVHQGDGTATILQDEPSCMTISVHCGTNFPFNKAKSDLDIPVPADTGDTAYLDAVDTALHLALRLRPELILFQGGVDALATDKLGRLNVTRAGMRTRNRRVFDACLEHQIPCVVFMGGGYSRPIEASVDAFFDLFSQAAEMHQHLIRRDAAFSSQISSTRLEHTVDPHSS